MAKNIQCVWKFGQKIKMLLKNRNFAQKTKFGSKVEILVNNWNFTRNLNFGQNLNFCQKSKFLVKIFGRNFWSKFLTKKRNFGEQSKFGSKNQNVGLKWKFWSKIEILVKSWNFGQQWQFRNFGRKSRIIIFFENFLNFFFEKFLHPTFKIVTIINNTPYRIWHWIIWHLAILILYP